MLKFINLLNSLIMYEIFNTPAIVLLTLFCSLVLFFRIKFFSIFKLFSVKSGSKGKKNGEISGFAAFMSAAGATLGMGNIIGGAITVAIGGAGSLIWILIFGFVLSIIKFAETVLGHHYRKEENKTISGGAFFYIKYGLRETKFQSVAKIVAFIYTILFIIAYTCAGSFQLNQISVLFSSKIIKTQDWNLFYNLYIAIPVAFFVLFILFGGIKRIGHFSTKAVPLMVIGHLFCSFYVILENFQKIISVLNEIWFDFIKFGNQQGFCFVIAYSMQRILFGSDSGTGASAIANSNSNKDAVEQGLIVAIEPILVAFLMITSGIVVLITKAHVDGPNLSGITLINHAFEKSGVLLIFWINMLIFGFTSVVSDGYYIEKAWYYLTNGKYISFVKILYCTITIFAAILPFSVVMPVADVTYFLAVMLNLVVLIILSKKLRNIILSINLNKTQQC